MGKQGSHTKRQCMKESLEYPRRLRLNIKIGYSLINSEYVNTTGMPQGHVQI